MAKITVIVTVHNTEDYIVKCIESIKAQTLKDLSIVLVENGSTDNSLQVCRDYAAADPNIKVIHLEKGDVSIARNTAAEFAKTDFIAFMDSDDTIAPEMYETLYAFAEDNDLDLVYSNHVLIYDDKQPRYNYPETGEKKVLTPKQLLMMNFAHKVPLSSVVMIARRRLFDNIKFPESRFFEDRAFTYLLINSAKKVGYVDKAFYHYYQRKGSIVHSMDWKKYYDFALAEVERLKFIKESDLFTDEEKVKASKIVAKMYIRMLKHALRKAKTTEQKKLSKNLKNKLHLIPEGCKLSSRSRLYRKFIKVFY